MPLYPDLPLPYPACPAPSAPPYIPPTPTAHTHPKNTHALDVLKVVSLVSAVASSILFLATGHSLAAFAATGFTILSLSLLYPSCSLIDTISKAIFSNQRSTYTEHFRNSPSPSRGVWTWSTRRPYPRHDIPTRPAGESRIPVGRKEHP